MENLGEGRRVRIYLMEGARSHGHSLRQEIVGYLRRHGAMGATVFRGIEGFGPHHRLHSDTIEVLMLDLPIVIEWIDTPERVAQLLPEIRTLVGEGLIVADTVEIVTHGPSVPPRLDDRQTIEAIMTRQPATVFPETPIQNLVELLVDRNYRALPVVDHAGKLIGLVTNGDLIERGGLSLRAELLHFLEPEALGQLMSRLAETGLTAAGVMTADVVTVAPDTSLGEAAHVMALKRLKRLPVVDRDGQLVGIVSRVDVLRAAAVGALTTVGEPEGEALPAPPSATVAEVMTPEAPAVAADAGLPEVVEAVVSTRLNRAVVVDEARRPIGVVTDAELLRRLDPAMRPSLARLLMRKLPFMRLSDAEREALRFAQGTRAAELMIAPVLTVRGETPAL
ncbi:MAG TPA: DUF190 domain-containing protein, partial [Thermomicrobiaceae bacterium]|nr:DUF190 domain-containing protein [Thermomicrobiaceae bacterium]